jgi:ApaG protein
MESCREIGAAAEQSGHCNTLTEGIRVRVGARLVPSQTDPSAGRWIYAYRVTLSNEGESPARLLSRHWVIRDADNQMREVRGPGVVGKHPQLKPGESFSYVSSCPLETEWGTMEGWYHFERGDGEVFAVRIGRFFLAPTVAPVPELEAWITEGGPPQP